jgi:hypothetical protein
MDFSNVSQLDSAILFGIVNEKLRLECSSFDDLTVTYELDSKMVTDKLSGLGYQYDPLTNQFKSI